jgi:hypothetical protein
VRLEAASAAPARILAGCKRTRILTATIFVRPTRSRRAMRNTSLPSDVSMNSPDSVTASGSFTWLCVGSSTSARLRRSGERAILASCNRSTRYTDGRSMPPLRPRSIASCESRSSTRRAPTSWRRLCATMRESWKWRISKLASRQIRDCWRCSWKSWARAFPSSCWVH